MKKNGKTGNLHFEIQIGTFGLCWLILNDLPRSVANFINRKISVFTIISTKCKNDHANAYFYPPFAPIKKKRNAAHEYLKYRITLKGWK